MNRYDALDYLLLLIVLLIVGAAAWGYTHQQIHPAAWLERATTAGEGREGR